MFKVNNKDTRIKIWYRSGIFIVNFEHISHLVLLFPLLTLIVNSIVSIVIAGWDPAILECFLSFRQYLYALWSFPQLTF